jgi:hypothetical protein
VQTRRWLLLTPQKASDLVCQLELVGQGSAGGGGSTLVKVTLPEPVHRCRDVYALPVARCNSCSVVAMVAASCVCRGVVLREGGCLGGHSCRRCTRCRDSWRGHPEMRHTTAACAHGAALCHIWTTEPCVTGIEGNTQATAAACDGLRDPPCKHCAQRVPQRKCCGTGKISFRSVAAPTDPAMHQMDLN